MDWISVEDRLPEKERVVLGYGHSAYNPDANVSVIVLWRDEGTEQGGYWIDPVEEWVWNITHWMPLPDPPTSKP